MLVVPYTENGNCYLISNFANSNNPLFISDFEIENFRDRILRHLVDLVDILAYSLHSDHCQIVLVLKDREAFEDFYRRKKKDFELDGSEIPESTYILSQEMANLQSGFAKSFNYRHGRYGSLFGRRYTKVLLEDREEVREMVDAINTGRSKWDFEQMWSYLYNLLSRYGRKEVLETTRELSGGGCSVLELVFPGFLFFNKWELRGRYKPTRLKC